jgi:hypothetical protein
VPLNSTAGKSKTNLFLYMKRGMRQGFPFSLFLYILVVDYLSRILKRDEWLEI